MSTKPTGSKINALKLSLLGAITGTVGLSWSPLAAQASTEFEIPLPETSTLQPASITSGNEALQSLTLAPQLADTLTTAQAIAPVATQQLQPMDAATAGSENLGIASESVPTEAVPAEASTPVAAPESDGSVPLAATEIIRLTP